MEIDTRIVGARLDRIGAKHEAPQTVARHHVQVTEEVALIRLVGGEPEVLGDRE